jgi:hypothetical protein
MKEFSLKIEKLETKSEICHLNDDFDAVNNACRRCSNVTIEKNIINVDKKRYKNVTLKNNLVKNIFKLIVSGALSTILSIVLYVATDVYVSTCLRGVIIFFIGFLPVWVIYYKIGFKLILESLLDILIFVAFGGLIGSLLGVYHFGLFVQFHVEIGLFIGAFVGSVVKTFALLFQLVEQKKI